MAAIQCDPSPGCLCYQDKIVFGTFLERHKPSEIIDPKTFWILVENPTRLKKFQIDIIHVQLLWKQLTESGDRPDADDIKAIASATGYTSGKWLIFCRHGIDELWATIAQAVRRGDLGPAAKVSTKTSAQERPGKEHVICVYTEDYTDSDDVYRVARALQDMGVCSKLTYKPDIYTNCGIYVNNAWGIQPTLYKFG